MADARQRSREATRQTLVEAAQKIIADQGVDALTMRRLAAAVGYTPGALYTHFAGKGDLMLRLAYDTLGRLASALRQKADSDRISAVFGFLQANPADRAVLAQVLGSEAESHAESDTRRLVLGRLIRVLRSMASGNEEDSGQQEAISALALIIGALVVENAALLKSLGFTGGDVLNHYRAGTGNGG